MITNRLDRWLAFVLSTALEGGSNYWYCNARDWKTDTMEGSEYLNMMTEVTIDEYDETDDSILSTHHITLANLRETLTRIVQGHFNGKLHPERMATLLLGYANPDEADYDAWDADVFLQIHCFGEVRYG